MLHEPLALINLFSLPLALRALIEIATVKLAWSYKDFKAPAERPRC